MYHLNPKNPGVRCSSKSTGWKERKMFLSLPEREVRPRDEDKRQGAPGGLGPGREEVSSHMHSERWIIDGSEVKSSGQKAKEQRKGTASFRH